MVSNARRDRGSIRLAPGRAVPGRPAFRRMEHVPAGDPREDLRRQRPDIRVGPGVLRVLAAVVSRSLELRVCDAAAVTAPHGGPLRGPAGAGGAGEDRAVEAPYPATRFAAGWG